MSPRTRGFNDVPSPHDRTGPPNRGDKARPMGAPPPQRVTSVDAAPEGRRPSAFRFVLVVVILGALVAVVAYFAQHPAGFERPAPTGSPSEVSAQAGAR